MEGMMEIYDFRTRKPSEIRFISKSGNKAILALELFSKGVFNDEFIKMGLEFCDLILEGLEPVNLSDNEAIIPFNSKYSILRNENYLLLLSKVGINLDNIEEKVNSLKLYFSELISDKRIKVVRNDRDINEFIILIKHLSHIFFMADVQNLRQIKEKGGAKAYG
jgi:hypothetical protein